MEPLEMPDFYVASPAMPWTPADQAAASGEGWAVFESSGSAGGPLQICKLDEQDEFASDDAAWAHVTVRAVADPAGLHARAIRHVAEQNPLELAFLLKEAPEVADLFGEAERAHLPADKLAAAGAYLRRTDEFHPGVAAAAAVALDAFSAAGKVMGLTLLPEQGHYAPLTRA